MGAAGKKREEELLAQIEDLKQQVAERDAKIGELNAEIVRLMNQI